MICLALLALGTGLGCGHRPAATADDSGPGAPVPDATFVQPDLGRDLFVPTDLPTPETCAYERLTEGKLLSPAADSTSVPSVAYAGDRFGVVWLRSSAGDAHPIVRLRLLDKSGKPQGAETTAGPESHAWAELGHDSLRANFGLCWHTDSGGKSRVAFRTISPAGALGTPHDVPNYSSCYAVRAAPASSSSAAWLVLVRGYGSDFGIDETFRYAVARLGPTGALFGTPTPVLDVKESQTVALAQGLQSALVAYVGADTSNSYDRVFVRPLGADAIFTLPLSGLDGNARAPQLVAVTGGFVVIYAEEQLQLEAWPGTPARVLYLQKLDMQGQPQGARVALSTPEKRISSHAVVWDGNTLLLLTVEQRQLEVGMAGPAPFSSTLRFEQRALDGARRSPDIVVTSVIEKQPSLGYPRLAVDAIGRRALAAWNLVSDPGGQRGVYTAVLGCTYQQ